MSFDIKMRVNDEYDITLRNVKASDTVANLIEMIKKEINMKGNYRYIVVGTNGYYEERNISDIVENNNNVVIKGEGSLISYLLYWNVVLIEESFYSLDCRKPVKIQYVNGESKTIEVDLSVPVMYLMKAAKRAFGLNDTNGVILTFAGRRLDPYYPLLRYGIGRDSLIHCCSVMVG